MVNGTRVSTAAAAYRPGHRLRQSPAHRPCRRIFGDRTNDMLSGYRVFSRRFVKSFPALAAGFETETELTVHALEMRLPFTEIQTPYNDRPPGSVSKLSTFRDGLRILCMIGMLVKEERPMQFFSVWRDLPRIVVASARRAADHDYIESGLVPRLPTAVFDYRD